MNFTIAIIALTGILCCVSLSEGGTNYTSLGCFRDKKKPVRALDSLEGMSEVLDGRFKRRENAVEKCAEAASSFEYEIFAVSRGGECLAGFGSVNGTFEMYGPADNCQADGEGGRRPAAMEVYEIAVETCEELTETCYGDCCDDISTTNSTTSTEMRCPGYWDWDTGCQLGADYCVPYEQENYRYAKSLGAPETCYGTCYWQCNYAEEIHCMDYSSGCGYEYCYWTGEESMAVRAESMNGNNGTCYPSCPTSCHPEFDIVCSSGTDSNGCSYGDYCLPSLTDSWDGTGECPGVCYTPCNYEAGEVWCGNEQTNSCFTGNYCEVPDADGNACQGTAMRLDHVDERMLRGSPDDISAFYKTLTNLAKK